jgi:hypothetical protein
MYAFGDREDAMAEPSSEDWVCPRAQGAVSRPPICQPITRRTGSSPSNRRSATTHQIREQTPTPRSPSSRSTAAPPPLSPTASPSARTPRRPSPPSPPTPRGHAEPTDKEERAGHAETTSKGEGGRHDTGAGTHGEHTPPVAVDGSVSPP